MNQEQMDLVASLKEDISDYKDSIKKEEQVIEGSKQAMARFYKMIAEAYIQLEELKDQNLQHGSQGR